MKFGIIENSVCTILPDVADRWTLTMGVYKQTGSKNWWYKFVWDGKRIRESTRQPIKRVAEQMEASHKAGLAKGEVGIREKKSVPTFSEFARTEFLPFIDSRFVNKPKTLEYYRNGVKSLSAFAPIATANLDSISTADMTGFISKRRKAGLKVSSINRELEVLRRMLRWPSNGIPSNVPRLGCKCFPARTSATGFS